MNNKTVIVRDLEFHYPHLMKSHAPFGDEVWDVQLRTTDEAKADELREVGVKMKKHEDGYFHANVRRKIKNRKGEPNSPVSVVDANKNPWNPTVAIGNGSKGHVKLFSYEWSMQGRSGVGAMLAAVQITEHVEYNGGDSVDFDVEGDQVSTDDF